jgi:hypothetical protein
MPPLPSDARPLYEIVPEVRQKVSASDIYAPGHSYAMPVNIQKAIEKPVVGSASTNDKEKEDAKKKQKKKDKYKVKF